MLKGLQETWVVGIVFFFGLIAPAEESLYDFTVRMRRASTAFGRTNRITFIDVDGGSFREASEFVEQTFPSELARGATARVSVTMRNKGFFDGWTPEAGYKLANISPGNDSLFGFRIADLPVAFVGRDRTVTFEFDITAPQEPGFYLFQTRMLKDAPEGRLPFGAASQVVGIVVR